MNGGRNRHHSVWANSFIFLILAVTTWGVRYHLDPPTTSTDYANSSHLPLPDTSTARVVIIGSSRFVYGLDDGLITDILGIEAVNVSRTASRLEEVGEFVFHFTKRSPEARFFLIELQSPKPKPYIRRTERQTAWHSLYGTVMLVAATWADNDIGPAEKWEYSKTHLVLCALRNRLFGRIIPPPPRRTAPESYDDDSWRKEHEQVLANLASGEFSRDYEESKIVAAFYRSMIRSIREMGAEPIFVLMPIAEENDLRTRSTLKAYVDGCLVIDLADFNENRTLYEIDNWVDPFHLNERGSKLASIKVAREITAQFELQKIAEPQQLTSN